VKVYIDGDCPICRALGRFVPAVPYQVELPPGLSLEEAEEAVHLWEEGRLYRGFSALVRLARKGPFLPLWPLLLLLERTGLGERAYRAFARRRPKRKGRG
jgi:predicted DCC family thiol-disulfide oxidoreductase YuxK